MQRHTSRLQERSVFHLHQEGGQSHSSEHVLEVQTLRALALHTLIFASGSMAERSVCGKIPMLFNGAPKVQNYLINKE